MRVRLGRLTTDAVPFFGEPEYLTWYNAQPKLMGRRHRHVYTWDCAYYPYGNPALPDTFRAEALIIPMALSPLGQPMQGTSRGLLTRLLSWSGVRTIARLDRALNDRFPPVDIPIPWAWLDPPMDYRYKLQVVVRLHYRYYKLRPRRRRTDFYVLGLPYFATFAYYLDGTCEADDAFRPSAQPERYAVAAVVQQGLGWRMGLWEGAHRTTLLMNHRAQFNRIHRGQRRIAPSRP